MTKAEKEDLWATRIAEFRESEQSVPVWCTNNDVNPRQLYYWLRREREADNETKYSWLSLDLSDEAEQQTGLSVKVGRVAIEVKSGFDPDLLADVVKVLSAI